VGNHHFVIFAVLDVSCAVNSCINHSFFTFISYIIEMSSPRREIETIKSPYIKIPSIDRGYD